MPGSQLFDISKSFKALYSNVNEAALTALNKAAKVLRYRLQERSPVDSGRYAKSWRISAAQHVTPEEAKAFVFNNISYGDAIEHGSTPGMQPWPGVGPKTVKNSYFDSPDNIWSSEAPGGPIQILLHSSEGSAIMNALANDVIKGIKW